MLCIIEGEKFGTSGNYQRKNRKKGGNNYNSYYIYSIYLWNRHCSQQPYEVDATNILILETSWHEKNRQHTMHIILHRQICFGNSSVFLNVFSCKIKWPSPTLNLIHLNWIRGRVSDILTKNCDYNFCEVDVTCLQNHVINGQRLSTH